MKPTVFLLAALALAGCAATPAQEAAYRCAAAQVAYNEAVLSEDPAWISRAVALMAVVCPVEDTGGFVEG